MIEIHPIMENKKQYLELLLLADEQEDMVDKYLERGEMFVLMDGKARTVAVITEESQDICEIKNIATVPNAQRKGYGRKMLMFLFEHYRSRYQKMLVGTGDVPSAIGFYKACGFTDSHRVPHFFTRNYRHPIIEEGILLDDMVYLQRDLY